MRFKLALLSGITLVGMWWAWAHIYVPYQMHHNPLECLALNVYWEATVADESEEGQRMVAKVTHTRAQKNRWYWGGNTICGVVYARRTKQDGGIVCQFSWTCMSAKDRTPQLRAEYEEALRIAEDELNGKYTSPAYLAGATSYLNPNTSREKNRREFAKLLVCLGMIQGDRHVFYRDATDHEREASKAKRSCPSA